MKKELFDRIGLDSGMLNYVDNETPRHYFVADWANTCDLDLFGDMIIKKCIELCEEGDITQMTASGAADKIRQHFGIKE